MSSGFELGWVSGLNAVLSFFLPLSTSELSFHCVLVFSFVLQVNSLWGIWVLIVSKSQIILPLVLTVCGKGGAFQFFSAASKHQRQRTLTGPPGLHDHSCISFWFFENGYHRRKSLYELISAVFGVLRAKNSSWPIVVCNKCLENWIKLNCYIFTSVLY
jgi:hypothetical protein